MSSFEPRIGWVLERAATQYAETEGTVDLGTGERRTWRETQQRVSGVAAGLRGLGLEVGDRVGVLSLNSARHLELWFAIPEAGLVMNDLNFRLAVEELAFIANDSNIKVLFVDDTFLEAARQMIDQCDDMHTLVHMDPGTNPPEGTTAYDALAVTAPTDLSDVPVGGDDVAAIFYTGGTTGLPKGAMLTHRNLTSTAMHIIGAIQLDDRDRYLHCGPQFHLADGAFAYGVTWMGGTHVFIPAFEPARTMQAIEAERITSSLMVPTMINMIIQSPDLASVDLSSLRAVFYGASPMPSSVQKAAIEAFGPIFAQGYGMTEASPLVTVLSLDAHKRGITGEEPWASRMQSAGSPVAGVRVEVRREDGVTVCSPGEAGELYIQGPNIMSGYWNRAEETAFALVDGWYRSGDVAYADEGGYLFIVDRAKDMIISGGENIYTTEVENAVYSHPAVLEAAAFGIPHDEWGETVHVVVVTKPGTTLSDNELIEHCRTHIAGYKLPRSVNIRSAEEPLPKSGAGKILKRDLRDPFWAGLDRGVN
jgi:long-chain acyl-CoA synthetase